MPPLNHMFLWCHKKRKEEGTGVDTGTSERDNKGYYRCKVADRELYDKMKKKYSRYVSREFLTHFSHQYDTQLNKRMNISVAKYVTKGTNIFTTTSLITYVHIAAGIQLVGNHFLWVEIIQALDISVPSRWSFTCLIWTSINCGTSAVSKFFLTWLNERRMST